MSFFLLGRTTDGTLALLSDEAYSSRQDALTELSRLTSDPEFDGWDTEVLVLDIDTGTPVLLVRPAGTQEAATEEPETPAEPEATAELPASEHDEALAAVLQDLEDAEPAEPTPVAEDAFVAEAADEPVVQVDDAWAAAVDQSAETDQTLKDALLRTAAQMEAQGISAPESVGPASDDAAEAGGEPLAEAVEPETLAEEDVSLATEAEAVEEFLVEQDVALEVESPVEESAVEDESPAAQGVPVDDQPQEPDLEVADSPDEEVDEPAAISEPSAEPAGDSAGAVETASEVSPEQPPDDAPADAVPAWPWDESPDTAASPLAGLEEPGPDAESMIRALADDEASRTVVLGEYESAPVTPIEPELIVSAAAIAEAAAAEKAAEAERAALAEAAEPEASDTADGPTVDTDETAPEADTGSAQAPPESDFIDLGEVAPPPPKGYEPGKPDIEGMTCDDCVYVDSCPNKDEREPATCGSFQWK